jgi:hypothetical protein
MISLLLATALTVGTNMTFDHADYTPLSQGEIKFARAECAKNGLIYLKVSEKDDKVMEIHCHGRQDVDFVS